MPPIHFGYPVHMYLSSFKFTPCHDLACAQLVFWCVVYCTMPQKWKKNSAIFVFWKSSHWMANLSKLLLLFQFWAIFDDFSKRGVRRACPEGAWKIWKITQNWKKKACFCIQPFSLSIPLLLAFIEIFWKVYFFEEFDSFCGVLLRFDGFLRSVNLRD